MLDLQVGLFPQKNRFGENTIGFDLKPQRVENVMRSAVVYVNHEKGYELARHAATSFIQTQSGFQDAHVFCHNFLPSPSDRLIEVGRKHGVRVHIKPIGNPHTESTHGQITKTHFLKMEAVDRIAQAYDRILYVDHDILFFDEIFLEKDQS